MERKGQSKKLQGERKLELELSDDIGEGKNLKNIEREYIQSIDFLEEIEEDVEFLKDLAIICRFIGARSDCKRICKWIEETWQTPQITKFLPRGFFIIIFATEEERQKVLEGGLWTMDSKPLYIQ
ncbi:hypothetical protein SUGI_0004920 [Cryptomeria japonica]|nr:hypothetical protein SUGI_0004920 [Cryptomeria japonica]